jgi:hypothetical protein
MCRAREPVSKKLIDCDISLQKKKKEAFLAEKCGI